VDCFVSGLTYLWTSFSGWWKEDWISCLESFSVEAGSSNHGRHRQYLHKAWW